MTHEAKKRISQGLIYICTWLSQCGSFRIASILQQFCATSICCSLSFSFIGGISVLKFLQPFFLVTLRSADIQSQRSCSMLNLWVLQDFCLFSFFEDENGQEMFLHFHPDIKKMQQEGMLNENLRGKNQIENSLRAQLIKVSHHNLHCTWQLAVNLIRGVDSPQGVNEIEK